MLAFPEDLGHFNGCQPAPLWQLPEFTALGSERFTRGATLACMHDTAFPTPCPLGILFNCLPDPGKQWKWWRPGWPQFDCIVACDGSDHRKYKGPSRYSFRRTHAAAGTLHATT